MPTTPPARLLRWLVLAGLAVVLLALVAACEDDEDTPDDPVPPGATTTTPADTPAATPTATPDDDDDDDGTPGAAEGRTGDEDLDAIVVAVEEGDIEALLQRTLVQSVPCTTEEGAGGPPKCDDDVEQGTPVDVFPVVGCEAGWTDDPEGLWMRLTREARGLYAATEAGFETADWPQAQTYLVFHREYVDGNAGARLHVDGNGWIVAYWEGCQAPVEDLVQFDDQDLAIIAGPFERG